MNEELNPLVEELIDEMWSVANALQKYNEKVAKKKNALP